MSHDEPAGAGSRVTSIAIAESHDVRARPALHFTVEQGWTNDPHGIIYFGGKYHMFFQYNPAGVVWDKACQWGHATSDDLVAWTELPAALVPEREVGCWSGSAVVDGDEVTILYTTIRSEDLSRGAVALARSSGDLLQWQRSGDADVITGPPQGMAVRGFRDPFVWKVDGGWKALMGAGIVGYGGTALQYRSPDLEEWEFEGAISQRAVSDVDPVWTGSVWECPQLMEVDGEWLLVVSAWNEDVIHHVAYAVGTYDGANFVPRQWNRLTHGPSAYATTLFRDVDGRAVAMSWLRERDNAAPAGSPWASATSLPCELSIANGHLQARFHRGLHARLGAGSTLGEAPKEFLGGSFLVTANGTLSGTVLVLRSIDQELHVAIDDTQLTVNDAAREVVLGLPRALRQDVSELEFCIDRDILEVTWSEAASIGSARVNAATSFTIAFPAATSGATALLREADAPIG